MHLSKSERGFLDRASVFLEDLLQEGKPLPEAFSTVKAVFRLTDDATQLVRDRYAAGVYSARVEALPLGEYVRRKADSSKVYKRGAYDRSSRTYELEDCSDCSRSIYVKRGTVLFYGFTY
jgi:hypothetical protein